MNFSLRSTPFSAVKNPVTSECLSEKPPSQSAEAYSFGNRSPMNAPLFAIHQSDMPVESFDWGTLTWLCNGALSAGAAQTLGFCRILPGKRNPVHYHPNCEELLYVLSGSGNHSYDGESIRATAGMTIRIPAGVRHNFENDGGEPIECLIAFSSGERETVFLE